MNPSHPLHDFIDELLGEGRARVAGPLHQLPPSDGDRRATVERLRQQDRWRRLEAAGDAPAFDQAAAIWGAMTFAWTAAMLVDRAEVQDHPPAWIPDAPHADSPSAHWSVDLVHVLAADLWRRSLAIDPADGVHRIWTDWIRPWPLSVAGIALAEDVVLMNPQAESVVNDHPTLLRLKQERTGLVVQS